MRWWDRLRTGYEQDLDERAEKIDRDSYRVALVIMLFLAVLLPPVVYESGTVARMPRLMQYLWPLLPFLALLVTILLAQVIRLLRGGLTRRVALVYLAIALLMLAFTAAEQLLFQTVFH